MNKKPTGLMPQNIYKLIKTKELKTPAKGIFKEVMEIKTKLNPNMTEDVRSTIEYLNSQERNKASKKNNFKHSTEMALKIADQVLVRHGLPTDIPRENLGYKDHWELELDEYIKRLSEDEQNTIMKGGQELMCAFELKCAAKAVNFFEIVTAANLVVDPSHQSIKSMREGWIDFGMRNALRIGQLKTLLENQTEYGLAVDVKRKLETARKQSMWNDEKRDLIISTYNKIRSTCDSDHDAYVKTADRLQKTTSNRKRKGETQSLTWHMVRNLVNPGNSKKKK